MAIIKSVKGIGKTHLSLQKLINYVGEKAEQTQGINCSDNYQDVAQEFKATKEFYNKTDKRQYKHIVQSFKHGEITSEKAKEIALEFCEKSFKGYEIFIATHTDKDHVHNHIVLNSVNLETGLKYQEKNQDLSNLKKISNEICKSHSLSVPEKSQETGKIIAWDKKKYMALKKGLSEDRTKNSDIANTYLVLANVLEKEKIKSIDEFKEKMEKNGIIVDWQEQKKNVVFEVKEEFANSPKRKFRLSNLGRTFNDERLTKDNLEKGFEYTKNKELEKDLWKKEKSKGKDLGFER